MADVFSGTETVGTTEHSLTTDTAGPDAETSDGWFWASLDITALVAGDVFQFAVYEKVLSGGTQRLIDRLYLHAGQEGQRHTYAIMLMHGWDMTLKKITGTDRSISWRIRKASNVSEHAAMTETVSTTEWSIPNDAAKGTAETDDLIAQLFVDLSALTLGDQYRVRIYENAQVTFESTVNGPVTQLPILVFPAVELTLDWDMTIDKLAGTDRSITASIRKAA